MNVSARLVAGEQRRNHEWPEDAAAAQEPFELWVKALAYLTAASQNLRELASSKNRSDMFTALESLVQRGADPERIQEGIRGLTQGLAAYPQLAALPNQPPPIGGPLLFCGISLSWDKEGHTWGMWQRLRAGQPMFFCGLRSMSASATVALNFLDPNSRQNVLVGLEDVQRALPLWHCSAYPDELEVAAFCPSAVRPGCCVALHGVPLNPALQANMFM